MGSASLLLTRLGLDYLHLTRLLTSGPSASRRSTRTETVVSHTTSGWPSSSRISLLPSLPCKGAPGCNSPILCLAVLYSSTVLCCTVQYSTVQYTAVLCLVQYKLSVISYHSCNLYILS